MKRSYRIALSVAILLMLFVGGPVWYQNRYAMKAIRSFDVGLPSSPQHVLVATQGSAFKDAVLRGIVTHLNQRPVYVRVIDVSALPSIQEKEWSAIVILHTWENWRPQADAKAFVDRVRKPNKLVIVTTSGSGKEKMPGVDVISGASDLRDVPTKLSSVTSRLDQILAAAPE